MADMYDEYFIDRATLGGMVKASELYGNQRLKDIIFNFGTLGEAFQLAVTQPYLVQAFQQTVPHGVLQLAFDMARQCYIQFALVGAGAGIGAIIGGVGGTITLPLAGTVVGAGGGAALGAGIAGWLLLGIGLPDLIRSAKYISDIATSDLQEGIDAAMKGDKETAAQKIARFFAEVMLVVIPIIIVALLTKGVRALAGKFAKLPAMQDWIGRIATFEIRDKATASRVLGMTTEEISALERISGGKIIVVRGCNPLRLRYVNSGYHAKPVYIKWHTAAAGEYPGQVCISDVERLQIAAWDYEIKSVPNNKFGLYNVYKIQHRYKPNAPLNEHYLQKFVGPDGEVQYRILHPDGKPFVGDLDRVAYAEFNGRGVLQPCGKFDKNMHWLENDDPREVAFMNEQMRKYVNQPVSYNVFQHGNCSKYMVDDPHAPGRLMPGWPNRDPLTYNFDFNTKEPLLVCIFGRAYILNWEEFGNFCHMFDQVGGLFPWR